VLTAEVEPVRLVDKEAEAKAAGEVEEEEEEVDADLAESPDEGLRGPQEHRQRCSAVDRLLGQTDHQDRAHSDEHMAEAAAGEPEEAARVGEAVEEGETKSSSMASRWAPPSSHFLASS